MSTVSVGVRVPINLHEKLKKRATIMKASKSEVILTAIAQFLESSEDAPLAARMTNVERRLEELESLVQLG